MDGFERRKQKKIHQIITAAFDLFTKYGYSKVSVNEVAEKARVSPATIYNYFETKEKLYIEMFSVWMDKQLAEYEEILTTELSFTEKINKIMYLEAKNLAIILQENTSNQGIIGGSLNLLDSDSELKYTNFLLRLVTLGRKEGYIESFYTDEVLIRFYKMYVNELSLLIKNGQQDELTSYIDQFVQLFFYGLVGKNM